MKKLGRATAFALMAVAFLLVVGCDQGSKAIARSRMNGSVVTLLGGILVMGYVENQGAFLSLGAGLPGPARRALFIAFPLCLIAGLAAFTVRKKDMRTGLAAGFCLGAGGGAGNLLDRILHDGRVGDFINLGIGPLRTGIFNLADLSIMLGCVLVLIDELIARSEVSRREAPWP